MNDRIKELYNQADKFAKENRTQTISGPGNNYFELFHKKFAELIVQECADLFVDQKYMILNPHEPFASERIRALKDHDMDTVRKIKGHFGVK